MMADDVVEDRFKAVLDGIARHLKPRGFSKRGNAYRYLAGGNSALIEIQRSQRSTKDAIRFTLNVGVICGRLLDDFAPAISKAGCMYAHLGGRIGSFLPMREDKWWIIDAGTDTDLLIIENGATARLRCGVPP